MRAKGLPIPHPSIDELIHEIRGQRVILDRDLALVYGVATKRLNEQLRRNRDRFPADFAFQLTIEESTNLRSATSSNDVPGAPMRSQIATASKRNVRYQPYAFTEHGALQAANVLNSPLAVAMSLYVIRAFVRMRQEFATNAAIIERLAQIDNTLFLHDSALRDLYQKLRPLLAPPPAPAEKPRIGFHSQNKAVH